MRAHSWKLNKLFINGSDSTLVHIHKMDPNRNNPSDFEFFIIEGMNYKTNGGKAVLTNYYANLDFSLSIENKKKVLGFLPVFYSPNTSHSFFLVSASIRLWEIKKLTKDELIFETNYNSDLIRFEFKK